MPAVTTGGAPTLSQIRDWDVTHLENAAQYWSSLGNQWTEIFTDAHQGSLHPGGTIWEGKAAETAQDQSFADLVKVRGLAEILFSASAVARNGADDLAWAKRRVLDAVSEAEDAGFAVGEDLSVRYRGWMIGTDAEIAARQAQAEEFAAEIQSRAAVLMAMDRELAQQVTDATAPLDHLPFDEDSNDQIRAVDYRHGPAPRDNPNDEYDLVTGAHEPGGVPPPLQSMPGEFDPETGAAQELPVDGDPWNPIQPEPPFPPPEKVLGMTEHGAEQALGRDGHGVNDLALNDAVEHPTQPPVYQPDSRGGVYRYEGKDATVILNKDGEVVTTWPRNRTGWRLP